MCLIVHRTVNSPNGGSNLPNRVIEHNRKKNGDGFGIAWRDPKKGLLSQKFGPKAFDAFHKLLKTIDKRTTVEYVAHFRMATHGPACEALSHPFTYEDDKDGEIMMFHNGIISIDTNAQESDTEVFVRDIASRLGPRWWTKPHLRYLVEEAVGWSRLLIMTAHETVRLNAKAWSVENGIYYSAEPVPVYATQSSSSSWYSEGRWVRETSKDTDAKHLKMVDGKLIVESHLPGGSIMEESFDSHDDFLKDYPNGIHGQGLTDDEDEDGNDEDIVTYEHGVWVHMGHDVYPLDKPDAREGQIVCGACSTQGTYYNIDGKRYVDLSHKADPNVIYSNSFDDVHDAYEIGIDDYVASRKAAQKAEKRASAARQ
jgi:Glutamine amidotransferases class-II